VNACFSRQSEVRKIDRFEGAAQRVRFGRCGEKMDRRRRTGRGALIRVSRTLQCAPEYIVYIGLYSASCSLCELVRAGVKTCKSLHKALQCIGSAVVVFLILARL